MIRTTEDFIERAKRLHGDKYSYDKAVYVNTKTKVTVTCPVHGDFSMMPTNHYSKSGCPKCSGKGYKYSQEEVIERFKKVHGDKYDYSKVVYVDMKTPVTIICSIYGEFSQQPRAHLEGHRHPKQAIEERKLSLEEVINRFKASHGDFYDYSLVEYANKDTKVKIICPVHGVFEQIPHDHADGHSCRNCIPRGFDSSKPGFLYYLSINNGQAYKIGITNHSVEHRYSIKELTSIQTIYLWEFSSGKECRDLEKYILTTYSNLIYTGAPLLHTGNTELFNVDIFTKDPLLYEKINSMGQLKTT